MTSCCPRRRMPWSGATGAIARCKNRSTGYARKNRSVHAWRWTCGEKPKAKAVNKSSPHSIMHGLDKPGVFTTVSGKMPRSSLFLQSSSVSSVSWSYNTAARLILSRSRSHSAGGRSALACGPYCMSQRATCSRAASVVSKVRRRRSAGSNSRSKVCVKYAGPMELWNDALVTPCEDQSRRRLRHLRLSANTEMLRTACFLYVIGHRELLVSGEILALLRRVKGTFAGVACLFRVEFDFYHHILAAAKHPKA